MKGRTERGVKVAITRRAGSISKTREEERLGQPLSLSRFVGVARCISILI
jgi:hypothetical protein